MERRDIIKLSSGGLFACAIAEEKEYIIDIHQHVNFHGRRNPDFVAHQDAMGVSKTVLLPSGGQLSRESTHLGRSNGLAARIFGTGAAKRLTDQFPDKFIYFCNEIPDVENAHRDIEKWLKTGAKGIGELKFNLECDSKAMQGIYEIAREYQVPVLLHFQHGKYNQGFDRFHKMLEKYPTVNFIGHAQTFWGNIDAKHNQKVMYPKGPVTKGGLTDRYLSDYPNMWGDLSAGSGLNSMKRDLEHAAWFFDKHQNKLCLGTDCADSTGSTAKCSGSQMIGLVRELVTDTTARKSIYAENSKKIIKGL